MRFLRKSLSGLFLFGLTLGLFFFAGTMVFDAIQGRDGDGDRRGGGGRERVFAVNVVPFTPETQTPVLSVFGEVASIRVLDLRPATGGSVKSLHPDFKNGGRVMAGDLLVEIDAADAETAFAFALGFVVIFALIVSGSVTTAS
ncbi:MAG: hypothetical protein ACPG5U_01600, partial [Planktomarina sp.]